MPGLRAFDIIAADPQRRLSTCRGNNSSEAQAQSHARFSNPACAFFTLHFLFSCRVPQPHAPIVAGGKTVEIVFGRVGCSPASNAAAYALYALYALAVPRPSVLCTRYGLRSAYLWWIDATRLVRLYLAGHESVISLAILTSIPPPSPLAYVCVNSPIRPWWSEPCAT